MSKQYKLLLLFIFIGLFKSNFCDSSSNNNEQKSNLEEVKFDIIGDTSHLFAPEDFEKKEATLLYNITQIPTQIDPPKAALNHTNCLVKNSTDNSLVKLVNGSRLTQILYDSQPNECFFVLFYVPWCPFCAKLAPYFNALPRAFRSLDFLAFDVSKSIGYNTKFGTSAVPMIILFQQRNIISKFNFTDKILVDYIEFLTNKTGLIGDKNVTVNEQDLEGPVPTEPVVGTDYYLWIAWMFLSFVSLDLVLRKTNFKNQMMRIIKLVVLYFRPIRLNELGEPTRLQAIENRQNPQNHPHYD